MPIDPRTLSAYRLGAIEGDIGCVTCGYNLKGLPAGGKCPECGNPVASSLGRGRFLFKNLTDAPIGYLKTLRLGFFVLAGCIVTLVAAIVAAAFLPGVAAPALVCMIGVVWWGGVWLVTTSEYPTDGDLSHKYDRLKWLRWTNRTLQTAWSLAWAAATIGEILRARQNAAIAAGTVLPGGPPTALDHYIQLADTGAWSCQLLGLISLVPLCIHFAEIGAAAGNDALNTRLNLAAWGIALFGAYSVIWYPLRGSVPILGFGMPIVGLGMFISLCVFVFCLIELAIMCGWAVANQRATIARDRRLFEKAQREEAAVQARLARLPAATAFEVPRGALSDEAPIPLEPER
jgi:hypothetical protein